MKSGAEMIHHVGDGEGQRAGGCPDHRSDPTQPADAQGPIACRRATRAKGVRRTRVQRATNTTAGVTAVDASNAQRSLTRSATAARVPEAAEEDHYQEDDHEDGEDVHTHHVPLIEHSQPNEREPRPSGVQAGQMHFKGIPAWRMPRRCPGYAGVVAIHQPGL